MNKLSLVTGTGYRQEYIKQLGDGTSGLIIIHTRHRFGVITNFCCRYISPQNMPIHSIQTIWVSNALLHINMDTLPPWVAKTHSLQRLGYWTKQEWASPRLGFQASILQQLGLGNRGQQGGGMVSDQARDGHVEPEKQKQQSSWPGMHTQVPWRHTAIKGSLQIWISWLCTGFDRDTQRDTGKDTDMQRQRTGKKESQGQNQATWLRTGAQRPGKMASVYTALRHSVQLMGFWGPSHTAVSLRAFHLQTGCTLPCRTTGGKS